MSQMRVYLSVGASLALAALLAVACGTDSSDVAPTRPTLTPTTPGFVRVALTSNGATPSVVQITVGQSVLFANADSSAHSVQADPRDSSACAALNQVGVVEPEDASSVGPFTQVVNCSFHVDGQFPGAVDVGQ